MKRAIIALTFVMPMLTACFDKESIAVKVISAVPKYRETVVSYHICTYQQIPFDEEQVPVEVRVSDGKSHSQPASAVTAAAPEFVTKKSKRTSYMEISECGGEPVKSREVESYTVTFTYKGQEVTTVMPGPNLVLNIAEFDKQQPKQ